MVPGITRYTYGDVKVEQVRDNTLDDPDYVDGAVLDYGTWEGNYGSRVTSANLMGMETPDTEGATYLPDSVVGVLNTGKMPIDISDQERIRIEEAIGLHMENASILMIENVNSAPTTMPLFRGMTVAADDPITNMAPGDTFELPLSSFSYDKKMADQFAEPNQTFGTAPRQSVIFVMEKGAKGAALNDLDNSNTQIEIGMDWVTVPDEVISQGKYSVTSVAKGKLMGSPIADGADALYINIKHDKVFNLRDGRYESIK